jgi:hypothetical protein
MESSVFNVKLRGVDVKTGLQELIDIAMKAARVGRKDVNARAEGKGRGGGAYKEVTLELDVGTVKWWTSEVSKGAKGGTVMVDGQREFYQRMMEEIMWRSRRWGKYRRGEGRIEVTDDKQKKPSHRRDMFVVVVTDEEGKEKERQTWIFNGQEGEMDLVEWRRKGCIMMGFWGLVEAREWQERRASEEGWKVMTQGFETIMGVTNTMEGDDVLGSRQKSVGEMKAIIAQGVDDDEVEAVEMDGVEQEDQGEEDEEDEEDEEEKEEKEEKEEEAQPG